ncbi:hypothetical protein KM759_gp015 [Lymphocystis disease virus 4]|uniref:Uncharacterized protein n=1 Tax=Lymphocystis disease virus 4 TaxID=2704413 RepID=A0A6B9XN20_9VIRU|nr:hypothetical protein KM759_gp015 [Lymphocystis disease virus 4]QHR78568.1 hypothetical protein [Lymphocystis disease virus 4]
MELPDDEIEKFKQITSLLGSKLWIPIISYLIADFIPIPNLNDEYKEKSARLGIFIGCLCGFYALS